MLPSAALLFASFLLTVARLFTEELLSTVEAVAEVVWATCTTVGAGKPLLFFSKQCCRF